MNTSAPWPAAVARSRAWALAGLLLLVVLGLAWELWLVPTGRGTLALKVLPLVLALHGVATHRMYTYRWISLLIWLYFAEGVVRATTEPGWHAVPAAVEVLLSLWIFAACGTYVRARLRSARPAVA